MSKNFPFPRIASIYGSHLSPNSTPVELQLLARYDLLIGALHVPADKAGRTKLNDNIQRLREINPEIVVLDFVVSAPYWHKGHPCSEEAAYLHTTSGRRINGWPGTEMLNLSRPEATDLLVDFIGPKIDGIDLDGMFIDCMSGHFDAWAVEIESREKVAIDANGDGKEDTREELDAQWEAGKTELLRKLREVHGDDPIIMINAQRPGEYAAPFINGNYLEDYIDYLYSHNWDPEEILDLYLRWCDLPHTPNVTTINASSGHWPEYEAWQRLPVEENCDLLEKGYAQTQRMRFGLTFALMGDSYYGFDLNTRWRGQHWWYAEFDAPLGQALGPCERCEDGTWRRQFEGGLVVCNPLPRRARIALDSSHRDFTTGWHGREFVIPARDGRILTPIGY